jgi:arsenite methyltransferase
MSQTEQNDRIKQAVREKYERLAEKQLASKEQASCCGPSQACCQGESGLAESAADLYSGTQIGDLPDSVTGTSLGCGNPTAIAELRPARLCSIWVQAAGSTASWRPNRWVKKGT